ncbi:MAG: quinone-dependent dihydroorotate dehydrogenase [Candidatus Hydrogenedentota bacterium]
MHDQGGCIYSLLKNIVFQLDAERAHRLGMSVLSALQRQAWLLHHVAKRNRVLDKRLNQTLFNVPFENPVGLAAGFDKNAEVLQAWAGLGFGFVEVGTVTPKSQPGNPKPRLFRIPEEQTIQNAMGFNNHGMRAMRERVRPQYPLHFPLGINLGKNKSTPNEHAIDDYLTLIPELDGMCDYLVLNLSSPNTPGLRELENPKSIKSLFTQATELTDTPMLLKVSPDSDAAYTVDLCATAVDAGATGIIATNTSIDYTLTPKAKDFGGLSGAVIREKSFAIFDAIAEELYGKAVLISVGGIDSGNEAYRRLKAGASLVQVYSALIYEGPALIRRINRELLDCIEMSGYDHITDAIGVNRR